ncbi:TlpA family protein disulfide reductase [Salmonirosea aquatica]|uniref:Redoxin domain-containing protein n=1 Tax=Salmonirosea aquatica TaxID=2654236 RepID=A0A7C9F5F9_9BACT|nr:redoxin domain-containing protein [Cytophagaceae bacterium SJW1-29]
MTKRRFSYKDIPGWVVMLVIFGVLYATGLHTEAIGQVQRLILVTGIKNADVPDSESRGSEATSGPLGASFELAGLDGKRVPFGSLRGKVVFMNVWATWCPPCLAEMPGIQKLYDSVDTSRIAFVMLSVDEAGREKVKKFIDRKGYTFPVYTPLTGIPPAFQSSAIPTTFILSPEGTLVARQEGMANYNTRKMREFLGSLTAR